MNLGKNIFLFFFLFFSLAILSMPVFANSSLPIGLQKIIDYNNQSTAEFALKVSFLIAFVAGILGVLSPCLLPFLPAYFSYTFKEKKNITKMTLVFFLGFTVVFVAMGVVAGFVGSQVLSVMQSRWLVTLAGIFIIFLGFLSLSGRGLSSFLKINQRFKNDLPGTFLFGASFAVGWTACLGPILAGILGIGAVLGNLWYSGALLFFYSLGNLVPLFLLSVFYDRFNLSQNRFLKGKMFQFTIGKKEFWIHSTNLISGILLVAIGTVMIAFQGTSIINKWDVLGTKQYFYSLQRWLMAWDYANLLGFMLFILFVSFLGAFFWKLLFSEWRQQIFPELKGKVLEIGVGTGKNFKYYSKEARVTGIDFSSGMLNKAIKESNRLKKDYSLLIMDAHKLGFEDNSFDNVVCTFFLCSVTNPVKALKEMRRVCKPEGRIVMMEHVLSKGGLIAFLQHLHNPFSRFLFGFNVNRDTVSNIRMAGLEVIKEKNLASNDIFKYIVCSPSKLKRSEREEE